MDEYFTVNHIEEQLNAQGHSLREVRIITVSENAYLPFKELSKMLEQVPIREIQRNNDLTIVGEDWWATCELYPHGFCYFETHTIDN